MGKPRWFPCDAVDLLVRPFGALPMDAIGALTVLRATQWETGYVDADERDVYRSIKRPEDRGMTFTRFQTIWARWLAPLFPLGADGRRRNPDLAAARKRYAGEPAAPNGNERKTSGEHATHTPQTSGEHAADERDTSGIQAADERDTSGGAQPREIIATDKSPSRARAVDKTGGEGRGKEKKDHANQKPTVSDVAGQGALDLGGDAASEACNRGCGKPKHRGRCAKPADDKPAPLTLTSTDACNAIRHAVLVDPYPTEARFHSAMTKLLRAVPNATEWQEIADWLARGGDGWNGGARESKPSLTLLVKHFDDWRAKARASRPAPASPPLNDPDELPLELTDVCAPYLEELRWQEAVAEGRIDERGEIVPRKGVATC